MTHSLDLHLSSGSPQTVCTYKLLLWHLFPQSWHFPLEFSHVVAVFFSTFLVPWAWRWGICSPCPSAIPWAFSLSPPASNFIHSECHCHNHYCYLYRSQGVPLLFLVFQHLFLYHHPLHDFWHILWWFQYPIANTSSSLDFLLFGLLSSNNLIFHSTSATLSHSHSLDLLIHNNCKLTTNSVSDIPPSKHRLLYLQVTPITPTHLASHNLMILPSFQFFHLFMVFYLYSA